jgi:predicted amidophosphoribosyltransferase
MIPAAHDIDADRVTWVPSTRASESVRGFNPAEELARPLALSLRLHARALLTKRRETLDSAGLSREQRRVNLLDALVAKGRVAGHVLLVDDIFTTGATADECAAALKRAGAREVSVVTFARAL